MNEILRTSGFSQSSDPTSFVFACAVTILITPFGIPALSASSASASAVYGVSDAGLMTQVHPAAMAAPTFLVIIATVSYNPTSGIPIGKFQGVIIPTTPTGCRIVIIRFPLNELGITSPYILGASSLNHSKKLLP